MKKVNVYLHGEDTREIKKVEVSEKPNPEEIVSKFKMEFQKGDGPVPYHISYQKNDDEEIDEHGKEEISRDKDLSPRSHIHCHRCKKIEVSVSYNGQIEGFKFSPSVTGKQVMKKAIKHFGITSNDATGMELKVAGEILLQLTDHVGSFAKYPECKVDLLLAAKINIQGWKR